MTRPHTETFLEKLAKMVPAIDKGSHRARLVIGQKWSRDHFGGNHRHLDTCVSA